MNSGVTVKVFALVSARFFRFIMEQWHQVFNGRFNMRVLWPLFLHTAFYRLLVSIESGAFHSFARSPMGQFTFRFFTNSELRRGRVSRIANMIIEGGVFLLGNRRI